LVNDGKFRQRFQQWLNNLWEEKDRAIEEMMSC